MTNSSILHIHPSPPAEVCRNHGQHTTYACSLGFIYEWKFSWSQSMEVKF